MTKPTEIELHAGHAVKVKGAVGHIDEFTENRRLAKRVYEMLTAAKVPATYYEDAQSTTQTQNINNLIKHHNADRNGLITSIHFNAGGDGSKAIGTEVLYYSEKTLAEKLAKAISDATGGGLKNRGAKQRTNLGVLSKTYEPAVLIEVCFVNSAIDVAIYRRDFDKICTAIAGELAAHIGYKLNKKHAIDNKAAFLNKVAAGVNNCWTTHRILPSVVLAQAILESSWGTSDKTLKANNLFGIKANSDWSGPTVTLPTKEHVNGKWINIDAKWRKYSRWSDSLMDHAAFLSKPRYKAIIGNTDYKSVCQELQMAGYATDPTYANKLISVIESNNLTKYDEVDELRFSSEALEQKVNVLLNNKKVQKEMIEKGIAAKAFNEVWRDKFNKGELAPHDILGLSALYAAIK